MHPLKLSTGWSHPFLLACVAALVAGLANDLKGESATISWKGGDSDWFDSANWNPERMPNTGDVVYVANGGTARVQSPGATSGMCYVTGTATNRLVVGAGGTLTLTKRMDLSPLVVGYLPGEVLIGGGTSEMVGLWMYSNGSGPCLFQVTGGVVNIKAGVYLAFSGGGPATIRQSGGLVNMSGQSLFAANGSKSRGQIELSGSGMVTNLGTLYLGYTANGGLGTLSLSNTAAIALGTVYAGGNNPGLHSATGMVTVSGGSLRASSTVSIGCYGRGYCALDAGLIRCPVFVAAEKTNSLGTVTVGGGTLDATTVTIGSDGAASCALSGGAILATNVIVGNVNASSGTLHITEGGLIRTVEDLVVGKYQGAYGDVRQTGGTTDVRHLYLSFVASPSNSTYALNGGALRVRSAMTGLATNGNEVFSFTGGALSVSLYMSTMPVLTNAGGTLSPGLEWPGKTIIQTDYVESSPSARLSVDLGGIQPANAFTNGPGYYDYTEINGKATLAGELRVNLINGFDASVKAADAFYVAAAGSAIEGAFANVASGGRVLTPERHSFVVYYGNNAATTAAGADPKKVTLTGFQRKPTGTMVTIN